MVGANTAARRGGPGQLRISTLEAPRRASSPSAHRGSIPNVEAAVHDPPRLGIRLAVLAASLSTLALRIPIVSEPAHSDEGGYLLVVRQWHTEGSSLYGDLFVDRPPLLMLFWLLADAAGGIEAARWLACLWIVVLVVCAGWAGRLIGGHRGAVWASVTAAALASTPAMGAREVNGELLAVPLLMASCTFTLMAIRRTSSDAQSCWAVAAGVLGIAAVLVKQNFVDALVFAVVLVTVSTRVGSLSPRSARRVLVSGAVGVLLPAAAVVIWATTTTPGLSGLWYALYGFRSDAAQVIVSQSFDAPLSRLYLMVGAGVGTGLLALIVAYFAWSWTALRRGEPVQMAVTAMLTVGLVAVALGGSYWVHYLVGLIPVTALAAASMARAPRRSHVPSTVVSFAAASAVVTTLASSGQALQSRTTEATVTQLLRAAGRDTDSIVITYGHPNVIERSGLRPAYRYIWSLPTRVLDPKLNQLTRTLTGPSAPTWLVQWNSFTSWDIDNRNRLASAVDAHYRRIARVCGVNVYLHESETRSVPHSLPSCRG